MKVGITETSYSVKYGFEKGLERLRNHGYEAIDYQQLAHAESAIYEMNNRDFEAYLTADRNAARNAGLAIHQVHGPWCWPPLDTTIEEREKNFELMSRAISGTALLGAKYFVIHPLMPFLRNDEQHKHETQKSNLDFMEKLSHIGRKNGVIICVENLPMPDYSLGSVEAVLNIVKTIDDDHLKVCIDTGHCTMFDMTPGDAVRLAGKKYLHALHIHDNDGQKDYHWPPFSGVIDWNDFGNALHEIEYGGIISLETEVSKSIPDELREYEEIGLFRKGHYIAELAADGKNCVLL